MENTKKNRELVLMLADAETEAVNAINNIMQAYGLPCYLFEPIVNKIHRQLIDGKYNEISVARVRENNLASSQSESQIVTNQKNE